MTTSTSLPQPCTKRGRPSLSSPGRAFGLDPRMFWAELIQEQYPRSVSPKYARDDGWGEASAAFRSRDF